MNKSIGKDSEDEQVKQSVADLEVNVGELRQNLEVTANSSDKNAVTINKLAAELNSMKVCLKE